MYPIARRPFVLLFGVLLALLLPLSFLGDLRAAFLPYLLATLAATLALYVVHYLAERRKLEPSVRLVIVGGALLRLALVPMPPSLSDDVYRYLWDGRLLLYGESPYLHVPADTSLSRFHDELLSVQGYPTTNTIYPPGATLIFASSVALGELVSNGYIASYYVLKLMLIAAETAAIVLLLRLLERRGIPRRRALLYAWHPLPIIELAGQGHTDAFWVLTLALGFYYYAEERAGSGLPALAVGAAVRVFPVLLIPLWLRFSSRRAVLIGLLASVPLLALFTPFLDATALGNYTEVMFRFTNYYEFNGGFYYGVKAILDELRFAPSNALAGRVATIAQFVVFALVWLAPTRDRRVESLAWRAMILMTAQIVLPAKVHVWYYVAPLFLTPLLWNRTPGRAWLWATLIAPLTYIAYTGATVAEPIWVLLLEWGGFALVVVWERFRGARSESVLDTVA